MKALFYTAILTILLLGKALVSLYIVFHFKINQSEITRLSCENKNRPEMKCNGTCYLAKKINRSFHAEQSLSKENERSLVDLKLILGKDWMLDSSFLPNKNVSVNCHQPSFIHALSFPEKPFLHGVFHPPQC